MKRLISALLTLSIAVQSVIPAFAAEQDGNLSQEQQSVSAVADVEQPLESQTYSSMTPAPDEKVTVDIIDVKPMHFGVAGASPYLEISFGVSDSRTASSSFMVNAYVNDVLFGVFPIAADSGTKEYLMSYYSPVAGDNVIRFEIAGLEEQYIWKGEDEYIWNGNNYADITISKFQVETKIDEATGYLVVQYDAQVNSAINYNNYTDYNLYCDDMLIASSEIRIGTGSFHIMGTQSLYQLDIPDGDRTWKLEVNTSKKLFELNYLNNSSEQVHAFSGIKTAYFMVAPDKDFEYTGTGGKVYSVVRNNSNGAWNDMPIGVYLDGVLEETITVDLPFGQNTTVYLPVPEPNGIESTVEYVIDPEGEFGADSETARASVRVTRANDANAKVTLSSIGDLIGGSTVTVNVRIENTSKYFEMDTAYQLQMVDSTGKVLGLIVPERPIHLGRGEIVTEQVDVLLSEISGIVMLQAQLTAQDSVSTDNYASLSYKNGSGSIPSISGEAQDLPEGFIYLGAVYNFDYIMSLIDNSGEFEDFPNSILRLYVDNKLHSQQNISVHEGVNIFHISFNTMDMDLGKHTFYCEIDTGWNLDDLGVETSAVLPNGNFGSRSETLSFTLYENFDLALLSVSTVDNASMAYDYTDTVDLEMIISNPSKSDMPDLLVQVQGVGQAPFTKSYKANLPSVSEGVFRFTLPASNFLNCEQVQVTINADDRYTDSDASNNSWSHSINVEKPASDVVLNHVTATPDNVGYTFDIKLTNNSLLPVEGILVGTFDGMDFISLPWSVPESSEYEFSVKNVVLQGSGTKEIQWRIQITSSDYVDSNPSNNTATSTVTLVSDDNVYWSAPPKLASGDDYISEDKDATLKASITNSSLTKTYSGTVFVKQDGRVLASYPITLLPMQTRDVSVGIFSTIDPSGKLFPDGRPDISGYVWRWGAMSNIEFEFVPTVSDAKKSDNSAVIQLECRPQTNTTLKNTTGANSGITIAGLPFSSIETGGRLAVSANIGSAATIKITQTSRVLQYPEGKLVIECLNDDSCHWLANGSIGTPDEMLWEPVLTGKQYLNNLLFVYDGTAGTREFKMTYIPGTPTARDESPDPTHYASRQDTNASDNVFYFSITMPNQKTYPEFETWIQYGGVRATPSGLDARIMWNDKSTTGMTQAKRELYVNNIKVWESNAQFQSSRAYQPIHLDASTLKFKGLNWKAGLRIELRSKINGGEVGTHPIEEWLPNNTNPYTNNEDSYPSRVEEEVDWDFTPDLIPMSISTDKSVYAQGENAKIDFRYADESFSQYPAGSRVLIRAQAFGQVKEQWITSPGGDWEVVGTFTFNVPSTAGVVNLVTIDANPEDNRTLQEKSYSNTLTTTIRLNTKVSGLDYKVVGNNSKTIFDIGSKPYAEFTVSADTSLSPSSVPTTGQVYIDDLRVDTVPISFDASKSTVIRYEIPEKYTNKVGSISVRLVANEDRVAEEPDYVNNSDSVPVTIVAQSELDLIATHVYADKPNFTSNQDMIIYYGFSNPSDTNITDVLVELKIWNPSSSSYESVPGTSKTVSIPAKSSVTYKAVVNPDTKYVMNKSTTPKVKFMASIDSDDKYTESNENNNQVSVTVSYIADYVDIEVISVVPKKSQYAVNELLTFQTTIRNNSKSHIVNGVTLGCGFSGFTNSQYDFEYILTNGSDFGTLQPGQTKKLDFSVRLSSHLNRLEYYTGNIQVTVRASYEEDMYPHNNIANAVATIVDNVNRQPNAKAESLRITTAPLGIDGNYAYKQDITFSATVSWENMDKINFADFAGQKRGYVTVNMGYMSDKGVLLDKEEIILYRKPSSGASQVPPDGYFIQPDGRMNLSATISLKDVEGREKVTPVLIVDMQNMVYESNEDDNIIYLDPITVSTGTDLIANDFSGIQPLYTYGEYIQFKVNYTEVIGKSQKSEKYRVDVYVDGELMYTQMEDVNRNYGNKKKSITAQFWDLAPGTHTVELWVNNEKTVDEVTYANNTKKATFAVQDDRFNLMLNKQASVTNETANRGDDNGITLGVKGDTIRFKSPIGRMGTDDTGKGILVKVTVSNEYSGEAEPQYIFMDAPANAYVENMSLPILIQDDWYRGHNTVVFEVNPEISKEEYNKLYAEYLAQGIKMPPRLSNGRLYEESSYADNVSTGTYLFKEVLDFKLDWYTSDTDYVMKSKYDVLENVKGALLGTVTGVHPMNTRYAIPVQVFVNDEVKVAQYKDLPYKNENGKYVTAFVMGFILPRSDAGEYTLKAVINNDKGFDETDFSNNVLTKTYTVEKDDTLPDFEAQFLQFTGSGLHGQDMSFRLIMADLGANKYTGPVQIQFMAQNASTADGEFNLLGDPVQVNLDGSGRYTLDVPVATNKVNTGAWAGIDYGDNVITALVNPAVKYPDDTKYFNAGNEIYGDNNTTTCNLTATQSIGDYITRDVEYDGDLITGEEKTLTITFGCNELTPVSANVPYAVYLGDVQVGTGKANFITGQDVQDTCEITPTKDGIQELRIVINNEFKLEETDYMNNILTKDVDVLPVQQDLEVVSIEVNSDTDKFKIGEPIDVTLKFLNDPEGLQGPKDVQDVKYSIFLGDTLVGTYQLAEMILGQEITEQTTLYTPGHLGYGRMLLRVELNPNDEENTNIIPECDLTNNTGEYQIEILPPSNLVMESLEVTPEQVPQGDPFTLLATVRNDNPVNPLSPTMTVFVNEVEYRTVEAGMISPGESVQVNVQVDSMEIPLGLNDIKVVVNYDKQVDEDDYSDNEATGKLAVNNSKDYQARIIGTNPASPFPFDITADVQVLYENLSNIEGTAEVYFKVGNDIVATEEITFGPREAVSRTYQINSGNVVQSQQVEVGINTEYMMIEETNYSNNVDMAVLQTRYHNVDGWVDSTELDEDDPVEIKVNVESESTGSIIQAQDYTSIISKVKWEKSNGESGEIEPGQNQVEFDEPIGQGETVHIWVTITTDDGYLEETYEVIYTRPTDNVDVDIILVHKENAALKLEGERVDNHWEFEVPLSNAEDYKVQIRTTEEGALLTQVNTTDMLVPFYELPGLTNITSQGVSEVYVKARSITGMKTGEYTARITIKNQEPVVKITNSSDLQGKDFSSFGYLDDDAFREFDDLFASIETTNTQGIPFIVSVQDADEGQYIRSSVIFHGRKYEVHWGSMNGYTVAQIPESGTMIGYAFVPADQIDTTIQDMQVYAVASDYISSNSSASPLSEVESNRFTLGLDTSAPVFTLDIGTDEGGNPCAVINGITDDYVGVYEIYFRHRSADSSVWTPLQTFTGENKRVIDLSMFYGDRVFEVWAVDKVRNESQRLQVEDSLGVNTNTSTVTGYSKNSRKATSTFINVRYRGEEDVDLTGFEFLR